MLFVLVVYMEVVLEPNIVSNHIKVFLDVPQWHGHIKDSQLKHLITLASDDLLHGLGQSNHDVYDLR